MAKTKSGFEFHLPTDLKDDFEYVELLRKYQENPILLIDVAKKLLGDEEYEALKKHCTVDGRVSTEKIIAEIEQISNAEPDIKK